MHTIGAAVVGTGFIGPVHVEALQRLGVRVTGILGSLPEKSEAARRRLGLARAYAHFDEILADRAVQAVHLAVPNVLHYAMAGRALRAGKHVMCEKPLAMNAEEASELVAIAAETGLHAGVCYNIRFYPLNLEARARIRSGELGTVFSVVGRYVQDWLLYDTDYNWRVLADQGGELRAVSDIGTHWMDLILSITGLEVEAVFADLHTIHPVRRKPTGEIETFSGKTTPPEARVPVPITTDDCGCVLLRCKGGARVVLWVSQATAGRKNALRYEIAGSKNAVAWDSERPNELWIGHRDRPNEVLMRDPALMRNLPRSSADYPGGHNEGFPDTFKQCFKAFYGALDAGTSPANAPYPTFADGHHEIVLCDAILQSHREERWISV